MFGKLWQKNGQFEASLCYITNSRLALSQTRESFKDFDFVFVCECVMGVYVSTWASPQHRCEGWRASGLSLSSLLFEVGYLCCFLQNMTVYLPPKLLGTLLSPSFASPREGWDFRCLSMCIAFYMDSGDPCSNSNACTVSLLPTELSSPGQKHDIWRQVLA